MAEGVGGVADRFVLACATVIEEMLPIMPEGLGHQVLEFGLHADPAKLRAGLQAAIDAIEGRDRTIILAYGLCSKGVIGLRSTRSTLVVPRVDDCISIFLGSRAAYRRELAAQPGSYYLTKGWIEAGDSPLPDRERTIERYGPERAARLFKSMLKNYTRLAFIDTGQYEAARYRGLAKDMAADLGLPFEEVRGSAALVHTMLNGPWGEDFIVCPPGRAISFEDFYPPAGGAPAPLS